MKKQNNLQDLASKVALRNHVVMLNSGPRPTYLSKEDARGLERSVSELDREILESFLEMFPTNKPTSVAANKVETAKAQSQMEDEKAKTAVGTFRR